MTMATSSIDAFEEGAPPPSPTILITAYLQNLFQFFRQTELHDPSNAIFDRCIDDVLRVVDCLLSAPGHQGLELTFSGEQIFVNKIRLKPRVRQFHIYKHFLKFMKIRKLGAIRIYSLPSRESLRTFLWSVAKITREDQNPAQEISNFLKAQGVQDFGVDPLSGVHQGQDNKKGDGTPDLELVIASFYHRIQKFAEICFDNLDKASAFKLQPIQRTLQELVYIAEEDVIQMLRLISVKRYDRPLPYRAVNACFLLTAWARSLRLPNGVVSELAGAALAHPLALLSGSLGVQPGTESQRVSEILSRIDLLKNVWPFTEAQRMALVEWMFPQNADGIYELDGTKCYPHFFSRMLRIVALFEGMTTYESGRRVYLPDEATAEIMKLGTCDPTLTKLFVNWLGVYPVGSFVALSTGEIAQIFAGAADPLRFQRPLVSVLKDADGNILERPQLIDLSEMNEKIGTYRRSIKKSISAEEANIPARLLQMPPVG